MKVSTVWYPWYVCASSTASSINLEGELFKDLMKGYNKNIGQSDSLRLPSSSEEGGQKCKMSVATILGQTLLFLIAKKVPETSRAVPLIGVSLCDPLSVQNLDLKRIKNIYIYCFDEPLTAVMLVTTMVALTCVIVLNVYLRTPNTHTMTDEVCKILLNILPRLLGMRMRPCTPNVSTDAGNGETLAPDGNDMLRVPCRRSTITLITKAEEYAQKWRDESSFREVSISLSFLFYCTQETLWRVLCADDVLQGSTAEHLTASLGKASLHLQTENEECFLVAKVIDRVCFIVMVFFIGTIGIFLMGHFNQPPSSPFLWHPKKYCPPIINLTDLIGNGMGANIFG
ncbi:LOW QUALITY PROTEIN: acetylcholine receptor subunit gamma [Spinachia spinachia]